MAQRVIRETGRAYRAGRGRFWKQGGGYTDDLSLAEVFEAEGYGEGRGHDPGRTTEEDAIRLLTAELLELDQRRARLVAMLERARTQS